MKKYQRIIPIFFIVFIGGLTIWAPWSPKHYGRVVHYYPGNPGPSYLYNNTDPKDYYLGYICNDSKHHAIEFTTKVKFDDRPSFKRRDMVMPTGKTQIYAFDAPPNVKFKIVKARITIRNRVPKK